LKVLAPDRFDVQSAGKNPGTLNALAVKAMEEIGIDISANPAKGVEELLKMGEKFDIIVTVCDPAAKSCPVITGARVISWHFDDPSTITGEDEEEKLQKVRRIRDQIKAQILKLATQENQKSNTIA